MSFDEPDHIRSKDAERPSTFLASIKTWRKTAGTHHPGEAYFRVERLTDVKQDAKGHIKIKTHWTPIWVPIQDLRGQESYEAARELIVQKFGEDVWTKTSEGWNATEPFVEDRIEYVAD
ncbi:hypothetical protein VFPPC_10592 [Pochonia chlamydosporia 170]|uniref:Uncharacterized protein n=1 Tax=Pochonia chlamydosporia 170 TaxID=1380566 RepID=A0A179F415_METCM|nr:hypothetical protein VFPPC_10592 [Pochonia chlamydosporia 170]OAQ60158.1 hypothetical protein VFPPC_10592 [Pochonia chlamydosporia 170]